MKRSALAYIVAFFVAFGLLMAPGYRAHLVCVETGATVSPIADTFGRILCCCGEDVSSATRSNAPFVADSCCVWQSTPDANGLAATVWATAWDNTLAPVFVRFPSVTFASAHCTCIRLAAVSVVPPRGPPLYFVAPRAPPVSTPMLAC